MLFDNPIFEGWYTDLVDVYRVVTVKDGSISRQERKKVGEGIPCRVYHTGTGSPSITDNAARTRGEDKISCDLSADLQAGDELHVIRGGNIGKANQPERYLAGPPQVYYDPIGGALTGLEHKEVVLLRDNLIGSGR